MTCEFGVEQMTRCASRKAGDAGFDLFKGHLTPEIKATITGSSMNTDLKIGRSV